MCDLLIEKYAIYILQNARFINRKVCYLYIAKCEIYIIAKRAIYVAKCAIYKSKSVRFIYCKMRDL